MNAAQLTSFSEEELDDYVGWIDWRSEEEEIFEIIREQTREKISASWSKGEYEGDFLAIWGESKFVIPLTESRVDRFVTICSLAVILEEKYTFFLREGFESEEIQGLLVVTKDSAFDLERNSGEWLKENFIALELGLDQFSGLKIPYLGNESNNPNLERELQEIHEALNDFRKELHDSPATNKIGRDLRLQIGTATPKDKATYYFSKYWWVILLVGLLIYINV